MDVIWLSLWNRMSHRATCGVVGVFLGRCPSSCATIGQAGGIRHGGMLRPMAATRVLLRLLPRLLAALAPGGTALLRLPPRLWAWHGHGHACSLGCCSVACLSSSSISLNPSLLCLSFSGQPLAWASSHGSVYEEEEEKVLCCCLSRPFLLPVPLASHLLSSHLPATTLLHTLLESSRLTGCGQNKRAGKRA